MILVADSGSSKCDWAFFESENNKIKIIKTIGFNPYFLSSEKIINELKKSVDLCKISKIVKTIFFYGSGCSDILKKKSINKTLSLFFTEADIYTEHDLLGACRSIYDNKNSINCILGTGSISCIYDGKQVDLTNPSLGYILGDEGSGSYFGKKVLNLYFNNKLTKDLRKDLEHNYNVSYQDVMTKVYNNDRSNYFLASFFPFLIKHRKKPIFFDILKNGVLCFLKIHVFSIPKFQTYKINFFGSVSLSLKDLIIQELNKKKCVTGVFENKPILGLFKYHYKK